MAEKPGWVRDFDRPKGTEVKHIRGNWYLYERSWRYDPKIRRSRKVSGRYLGKIVPEELVPSASRTARSPTSSRSAPPTSPGRRLPTCGRGWPATSRRTVRGARSPVARAYVRFVPAQGSGRGPREGVPLRA